MSAAVRIFVSTKRYSVKDEAVSFGLNWTHLSIHCRVCYLAYPSIAILGTVSEEVWGVVRADYVRRFNATKRSDGKALTQRDVAEFGGIAEGGGQNSVSRLFTNDKYGPTVEVFLRALVGLGVRPSEFFAAIEHQFPKPNGDPPWASAGTNTASHAPDTALAPASGDDPDRQLALEIGRDIIRACRLGRGQSSTRLLRDRRMTKRR